MNKLCKDCKHYVSATGWGKCNDLCSHPAHGIDLVRGEPVLMHCEGLREASGECGLRGFMFEPMGVASDPVEDVGQSSNPPCCKCGGASHRLLLLDGTATGFCSEYPECS